MPFKSFPNERQLDIKDSGFACLKMLAKHYGKYYSLQFFRNQCGVNKEGPTLLDLSYAAENIGLRTRSITTTIEDLTDNMPLPCLVHWNGTHYAIIYKIERGLIYASDPTQGLIKCTLNDFAKKWPKNEDKKGTLMLLEPQANFKQRENGEHIERKKTFENILGYFKPYKKSFLNLLAVMFIVTGLQALLPFISKAVIDIGIQTQDLHFINIVLIANITIIVAVTLSNLVRDWIMLHLASRINIALISDYLIKLMKLPITFYETQMIGDILQRANDHERIRSFIMNNSLSIIFSTLTFIVFNIILLIYNKLIFWIFLIGSVLYVLWVLAFLRIRKKIDWEYFEVESKNQSYWVETIGCIQDIKLNNYEKAKRWKWEGVQARLFKINLRMLNINNAQHSGANFIDQIKNILITFFCAKAVIAGRITFGVMISTQFIIGMLHAPVTQFIQFIIASQLAKTSFLRLNEIHQLADEDENMGTDNLSLPTKKDLILDDLVFQYAPGASPVLKGIRLIIPEGKVTAIVGDSGSGKSTLLKLILRLYKPNYGQIRIGDMNVNHISLRQWRNHCGAVMQDGKIFNDTILNNIVLDDTHIDHDRLKYAVETANISTEIEQLPLGYQTIMGEQGRGLSGGQKQRILIARALYKNPQFLIFDEATNALDTINEQKIVTAMEDVFRDKTVIVVAHRLSTIRKADQIVVMRDGLVVEVGNHESLMKNQGRYYQLVQSQVDLLSTVELLTEHQDLLDQKQESA
ncbi:MAG: peptidase domain-containing ABC transporter [Sphingobacteriaceae bacterium]